MRSVLIGLTLLTASCTKSQPETVPEPEPASAGEEAPPEEEVSIDGVAWIDMNEDQKAKYMEDVVMPTMKELFVAHDPAKYGESFQCTTCHGENAAEVGFAMPNGIAPLDPDEFPTPASPDPKIAAWATFMFNEVTPKMVALLGAEPYDVEADTGFGCYGCHEKAE